MWNLIPIIGWFLSVFFAASVSVPFWYIWTVCGIGQTYFYFLPQVYLHPGFWDCVGFFIVVSILRPTLTPHFFTINNSSESKNNGR